MGPISRPLSPDRASARMRLAAVAGVVTILALAWWAVLATGPRVLFDAESDFGRVRVVETSNGLRSLHTGDGRARQTVIRPGHPQQLQSEYARVAMIGLALVPADAQVLYVGLGGGAMPMYARHVAPGIVADVVEIDPLIVAVAEEYFGFSPDAALRVHVGDGRAFIESTSPGTYDLILLDAFSDDEIPYALATRQFLEAVRAALAPGGVVITNLWSAHRDHDRMVATYRAVLPHVQLIRVGSGEQRILVAALTRTLEMEVLSRESRRLAATTELGFDLPALVERGYDRRPPVPAGILED